MSLLPFLNKSAKQAQTVTVEREPDEGQEDKHAPLRACAEDILRAVRSDDPTHLALALRAAFEILESEPHEESPHTYEAQNKD